MNKQALKDADIRHHLLNKLEGVYSGDPETLVVQEFGLCQGDARVDMAVINGFIHGFEIKSEKDNLNRLPSQQDIYNKTLDYVTIVASSKHISKIEKIIPEWWGIQEVVSLKSNIKITELREKKENPELDSYAIVQLLWRNEALEILKSHNLHVGLSNKPRKVLWDRIAGYLSLEDLRKEVRNKIKTRNFWR